MAVKPPWKMVNAVMLFYSENQLKRPEVGNKMTYAGRFVGEIPVFYSPILSPNHEIRVQNPTWNAQNIYNSFDGW